MKNCYILHGRVFVMNRCRIPGAAYAPTTEFQTVQQPSASQPQVIRANGMKASEVGLLTVDCKKGFCTEENDVCCTEQVSRRNRGFTSR